MMLIMGGNCGYINVYSQLVQRQHRLYLSVMVR